MHPNDNGVSTFIEAVPSPTRRPDARTLLQIMERHRCDRTGPDRLTRQGPTEVGPCTEEATG